MKASILLLFCIVFGMVTKMNAAQSFAVGNPTQNESNTKMVQRNGNLIIAGLVNVNGNNLINITETTPSGSLVRTDNFTLQLPGYAANVVGELISDMIIDMNSNIVLYGRFTFRATNRPEPFIMKIDGNNRTVMFTSTLRIRDAGGTGLLFRAFTPSNIIEYHQGTDHFYYVAAVTYANSFGRNDTFGVQGNSRLYVARVDFTTGAFNRNMILLETINQDNAINNVDHSNGGMMIASGNRIMVYGYYGNGHLSRPVKPYIFHIDPSLNDNANNRGILSKYYFNSTQPTTEYGEGIHKLVEIGSGNNFYMYGYDMKGSPTRYRSIISRITLTPPAILGNNFGTISLSNYMFKSNLDNTNTTVANFGDIRIVPGSNNFLFTLTEMDMNASTFRIKLTSVNGTTGVINWTGYSKKTVRNQTSEIMIINNAIYCNGIMANNGSDDYYIFNPDFAANINSNSGSNLCYDAGIFTRRDTVILLCDFTTLNHFSVDTPLVFASTLSVSANADVTLFNCSYCWAASTEATIVIPNNTTITANEYWGRIGTAQKYYIEGLLTVDNAVLDITNIDVIFGSCGRINFVNNGRVRANNSVFRPCDENHFWNGLYFTGSTNNKIESCVFKNASVALRFDANSNGNVSNNQFLNCYTGIEINGNPNFNNPVSNNKFIVDRLFPASPECINTTIPVVCFGIVLNQTFVKGDISQNNFIYNSDPTRVLDMSGIRSLNAAFTASQNTFTNMYRAFDVLGELNPANAWKIINNEIELNKIFSGNTSLIQAHQIYIKGLITSPFHEISKNTIKKSESETLFNTMGIMLDPDGGGLGTGMRITNLSIRENYIEGFHYGIYALRTSQTMVTKNHLKNCSGVGILFHESNAMFISCNTIDMLNDYVYIKYGIQISNMHIVNNNAVVGKIHSNCIFNTERGINIYFDKVFTTAYFTPEIRNNYIYNYTGDGIYIRGMNSNIGDGNFAGMNSLISNNTTYDIKNDASGFGTATVTHFQNYSNKAFVLWSVPQYLYTLPNLRYSNASCANQNQHNQSNTNFNGTYSNLLDCESKAVFSSSGHGGGTGGGGGGDQSNIRQTSGKGDILGYLDAQNWSNSDLDKAQLAVAQILGNTVLDQDNKNQLLYRVYYKVSDYNSLKQLVENNKYRSDFFYLEAVQQGLETADSNRLLEIAERGEYTQTAYFLLSRLQGQYRFNSSILDRVESGNQTNGGIEAQFNHLSIYPNPNNGSNISVDIDMPGHYGFKTISVVDYMGVETISSPIYLMRGTVQIDISALTPGVYTVILKDENGKSSFGKFVKL